MIRILIVIAIIVLVMVATVVLLANLYARGQRQRTYGVSSAGEVKALAQKGKTGQRAVRLLEEMLVYDKEVMPTFPHAKQREVAQDVVNEFYRE